jgi:hypothetical protein
MTDHFHAIGLIFLSASARYWAHAPSRARVTDLHRGTGTYRVADASVPMGVRTRYAIPLRALPTLNTD